ncbi:transposase IS4 family protein [Desulfatibacillum aliphaticivorans]|uniref:Transposase IS4 family protein n=2 Tax=Desulfatibacillum aliphaticivorans TaxID=218208 RepID=B8FN06_DESAL|nr:transposase IS4 family protein [Desulfatibacillum aliphaticivorans]
MNTSKTFSLSMQKQIQNTSISMDSEINSAFRELKFRSLLRRSGIVKKRGYDTVGLMFLFVLLPFLKRKLTEFWSSQCLENQVQAQKETYYRFINHERFNWRKLVYFIAMKVIARRGETALKDKVLIADDSIAPKTGKDIELVSWHFDHKTNRSVLSNCYLQLGYHDGAYFYPLDAVLSTTSRRPSTKMRDIDKRTCGWKRRKEALEKKTDALLEMVQRAWDQGVDASFLLFDSWFAHDAIISKVYSIGYGVICRVKKGNVKYAYQGREYTLNQLWERAARKQTVSLIGSDMKGVCLNVSLPQSGDVRLLFVTDRSKNWQVLLCTDLEMEASQILSYYARRWAIEVFFKDAKQMLYMAKEQSNNFDALIACHSLVMIRYLLLVYILGKRQMTGPVGPLFRELSDDQNVLVVAQSLWEKVKELLLGSRQVLCYGIEPDVMNYILDIIEKTIIDQMSIASAKL